MSGFTPVIKTTVNGVDVTKISKVKFNGSPTNSYQDYEEIDYSMPVVTTSPSEVTSQSSSPNDLIHLNLNHLYNYYPVNGGTTTTTTVENVDSTQEIVDNSELEELSAAEKRKFIQTIISDYPQFASMLTTKTQYLGPLDSYVPQGVCNVNNLTLVSCYDGNKQNSPRILIIDPDKGRRWVDLDLPPNTHVGGIAYDPVNYNIWVTGDNGEIGCYSYSSIIYNDGKAVSPISSIDCNITNENGEKVSSYMTYYDGKIYVGSFNKSIPGNVKEYTIDSRGSSLSLTNEFIVPPKVQGLSFTKQNDLTYMAVSCSYGRKNDSSLKLYKYDGRTINNISDIKMPPMLEQVTFNKDGTLKCVFESSAEKYEGATVEIPTVCSLDISSCLK